jgi:two-component system, OmpR family, response regulator BaeR
MEAAKRILIIEDEPALASVLRDYLLQAGMLVNVMHDGAKAVEIILRERPDLVILDIMLPGKDGIAIVREVRASSTIPIILQTAKVEEIDRLLGLELGADDYLCKPFSPRELVARVKTILRRTARQAGPEQHSQPRGRIVLDAERWTVLLDMVPLELTRREFQLLEVLSDRPGRVLSRQQLLDLVFPDDRDVVDRTVDSHIKNIRNKIRAVTPDWDPIRSVYGVGYAFDE